MISLLLLVGPYRLYCVLICCVNHAATVFAFIGMLLDTTKTATEHKCFYLPSIKAKCALEAASNLLKWGRHTIKSRKFPVVDESVGQQTGLLAKISTCHRMSIVSCGTPYQKVQESSSHQS